MRTHFLNSNIVKIKQQVKILYASTIAKFEFRLTRYSNELEIASKKRLNDLRYIIPELTDTIDQLCEPTFELMFINLCMKFMEKIRYITIIKHTEECIIRATFDILFKYTFDFEYQIPFSCCNTEEFKKLQFDILNDCRWKIA